jgi:hypothetical protein
VAKLLQKSLGADRESRGRRIPIQEIFTCGWANKVRGASDSAASATRRLRRVITRSPYPPAQGLLAGM